MNVVLLGFFYRFHLPQLTICFLFDSQIASIVEVSLSWVLSTFWLIPDTSQSVLAFLTTQDVLGLTLCYCLQMWSQLFSKNRDFFKVMVLKHVNTIKSSGVF